MPEVYDDYPKNDSPELIKELIMKMTKYEPSDRPLAGEIVHCLEKLNAHVNPSKNMQDVKPSLRLLQALNDWSELTIDKNTAALYTKDWISHQDDLKRLLKEINP